MLLLLSTFAVACASGPSISGPDALITAPIGTTWTLEGTAKLEGHYARPYETRAYRARVQHVEVEGDDAEALLWTTWWTAADAPRSTTRVVRRGARLWIERDGRAREALDAEDRLAASTLLHLGERSGATRMAEPFTHGRLGDVTNLVTRTFEDGASTPSATTATLYESGVVWTLELGAAVSAPNDAESARHVAPPALTEPAVGDAQAAASDTIEIRPISAHVYEVLVPAWDSRVLAVEVGGALAVLQAPGDSATSEAIVDALAARWPERALRWVLPTHHHPYSMGGVRAFVAAGATVVTTPEIEAYVRTRCAQPFTMPQDRLARRRAAGAPVPVLVEVVHGRWTLDDGTVRLEAHDIGERSRHTAEHLVFAVYDRTTREAAAAAGPASAPRDGILFHGDLGWHPDGMGGVRIGARSRGLLETIDTPNPNAAPPASEPLAIARVWQSWPVADVPASFSVAELRALLAGD
ncbi:MAG: hypothetical protein R3F49_16315 [Planctomycetota bacterium]